MALTPGLAQALEEHFSCPVLDVYSTNESGPIGVKVPSVEVSSAMSSSLTSDTPTRDTYVLLQPHLYVEILDSDGAPCPPGERGEITLSGGFNPFLPLLRYRTGDYAALEFRGAPGRHIGRHMGLPLLVGLEGRPPVVFRAADGRPINNVDVSIALRPFPIAQYTLHQSADGALHLIVRSAGVTLGQLREAMLELFGADQALNIEEADAQDVPGGKFVQYTSDLA
jgi:phenylacetate-CoA ligase